MDEYQRMKKQKRKAEKYYQKLVDKYKTPEWKNFIKHGTTILQNMESKMGKDKTRKKLIDD